MKSRKLGDLVVSEIGMGCMAFSHGYGPIPDEAYAVDAIKKAFDYGCNFFDTAEAYGPNLLPENKGHNEKILGKALKGIRQNAVVATKLHLPEEEAKNDGVYPAIKRRLQASLERLQTDFADLYYLHRVNRDVPVEDVADAMGKLIAEGLIRGWGLSQVGVDTLRRAHQVARVSAVQNLYNMMERDCEKEVIPFCMKNGIGVVPFSPVASGFLSGKITVKTQFAKVDDVRNFVPQLSESNLRANQPLADLLRELAAAKNATPAQISLAWMLKKYPNVVPIPGSRNLEHILENLAASETELSDDEFRTLEEKLDGLRIAGHRGVVEFDGDSISDWGKK